MDTYIQNLVILCNKQYPNNIDFIKLKYNIETIELWYVYFEQNNKSLLIFNSYESEYLFIQCFNYDLTYIKTTYNLSINDAFYTYFYNKNKIYFNECHYSNIHTQNCNCLIKVKSITKLKINALIHLYKKNYENFDFQIIKQVYKQLFLKSVNDIKNLKHSISSTSLTPLFHTNNTNDIIKNKPIKKNILLESFTQNDSIITNSYNDKSSDETTSSTSSKSTNDLNNIVKLKNIKNISNDELIKAKQDTITKMLLLLKK